MFYKDSNVRFEVTWYDWNEQPTNPSLVKFRLYDGDDMIVDGSATNNGTGKYFYDYTPTIANKKLIWEWYGEIDGTPNVKRGTFKAVEMEEEIL